MFAQDEAIVAEDLLKSEKAMMSSKYDLIGGFNDNFGSVYAINIDILRILKENCKVYR